jgi:peptidoglycan hydrolase-like protein with peptidoglycan-binding domain
MPNVLLAKGARGELVRKVQLALTDHGFDPQGIDGNYKGLTETAVRAFQQANELEPTGQVDSTTWTALLGGPIPPTEERALQLTAAFEGHGFTLAQGNWDGAGITWGIIGFTLKHGELTTIILQIFDQDPELVRQAFGENSDELIAIMTASKAVQMKFADSISLGSTKMMIAEPWRSGFKAFGESGKVQALQLKLAHEDYGQPALETAADLGLKTELGRALAFDIHVQNGGIKARARKEIDAALEQTPPATEQELRVIIGNAVADASTSFKEDVRARKLTIATGTGKVHGETFVLSRWGLDETLADS